MGQEKVIEEFYLNASLDLKVITWLGQKTGCTSMVNILNEIGFKYYKFRDGVFELINEKPLRSHGCYPEYVPDGFKVIASLRNPFSQLVSDYRYDSIQGFENFLIELFKNKSSLKCFVFDSREPDFTVRMENMFEDYSKIEFITDSKFYKSGILERLTKYKMNETPNKNIDWKEYYNENLAKMVIKNFSYHFNNFYDENSWK